MPLAHASRKVALESLSTSKSSRECLEFLPNTLSLTCSERVRLFLLQEAPMEIGTPLKQALKTSTSGPLVDG